MKTKKIFQSQKNQVEFIQQNGDYTICVGLFTSIGSRDVMNRQNQERQAGNKFTRCRSLQLLSL